MYVSSCCLFAIGAAIECVYVTVEEQGICPLYNQTEEGYLPETNFHASCHRTNHPIILHVFHASSMSFSCVSEAEQDTGEQSESFAEVGEEAEGEEGEEEEEVEEGEGVDTDPNWAEDIEGSEVTEQMCRL